MLFLSAGVFQTCVALQSVNIYIQIYSLSENYQSKAELFVTLSLTLLCLGNAWNLKNSTAMDSVRDSHKNTPSSCSALKNLFSYSNFELYCWPCLFMK